MTLLKNLKNLKDALKVHFAGPEGNGGKLGNIIAVGNATSREADIRKKLESASSNVERRVYQQQLKDIQLEREAAKSRMEYDAESTSQAWDRLKRGAGLEDTDTQGRMSTINNRSDDSYKIKGDDYEKYVGQCYEKNGYFVFYNGVLRGERDDGVDLVAYHPRKGIAEYVQCKNYENMVMSKPDVISILRKMEQAHIAPTLAEVTLQRKRGLSTKSSFDDTIYYQKHYSLYIPRRAAIEPGLWSEIVEHEGDGTTTDKYSYSSLAIHISKISASITVKSNGISAGNSKNEPLKPDTGDAEQSRLLSQSANKLLDKAKIEKDFDTTDDYNWIARLYAWADDNEIADLHWVESEVFPSGGYYTGLPRQSNELQNLKHLNLEANNCISLPTEIGQLTGLVTLGIYAHNLSALPAEVCQLENLKELSVSAKITALPKQIGQLKRLKKLIIPGNNLTSLPLEIGRLTNLIELDLDSNRLDKLPTEIGRLTNLKELLLTQNNLSSLPDEIGQLIYLEELRVAENRLTSLPEELANIKDLTIYAYDNNITSLPQALITSPNLIISTVGSRYNIYRGKYPDDFGNELSSPQYTQ